MERHIAYIVNDLKVTSFVLKTGPILGAYISRGFNSFLRKWKRRYKCKIKHEEVMDFNVLQYEFYDENGKRLEC